MNRRELVLIAAVFVSLSLAWFRPCPCSCDGGYGHAAGVVAKGDGSRAMEDAIAPAAAASAGNVEKYAMAPPPAAGAPKLPRQPLKPQMVMAGGSKPNSNAGVPAAPAQAPPPAQAAPPAGGVKANVPVAAPKRAADSVPGKEASLQALSQQLNATSVEMFGAGMVRVDRQNLFMMMKPEVVEAIKLKTNGFMQLPAQVRRVWIDVGAASTSLSGSCNSCVLRPLSKQTLAEDMASATDLLVLAFDPQRNDFGELAATHKVLALPIAIAEVAGSAMFNEFVGAACSSLLRPNPGFDGFAIGGAVRRGGECVRVSSRYPVPVMRLDAIMELLPLDVDVQVLKIDTRGLELAALRSAGSHLLRVSVVIVASQDASPRLWLYERRATADDVIAYMKGMGFIHDTRMSGITTPELGEVILVFRKA